MGTFQWSPPHEIVVYVGVGLGLAVLLLLARRFARSPAARRWPLLLVRAGVLATLLTLLLNPVRIREDKLPPKSPEVHFLVDCSRSMALDRPTTRLDQIKQVIASSSRILVGDAKPHINLYRFGQELQACSNLNAMQPDDDATYLREALERLPALMADEGSNGVVIFSDGRTSETSGFDALATAYRRLNIPIHVFPVGDVRFSGDVAIQDVIAPRDALPGSRVPLRVLLRSHGYQGRRAEIRVRAQANPQRKPLATLPVTLAEGQQACDLQIDHDPVLGELVVEVPPFEDEVLATNNQVAFHIGARKPKVRVIYMEGTLSNEYRFIRDALVEDPNIECLALEVNSQYAERPTLYRVDDPSKGFPTTREELFTYDVIICSDIKRTAFTQEQLDWTVELVSKRGGGFVMIGGNTSFGAGYWDQTVWDELIPVDMSGQANSAGRGTCWGVNFRVIVPTEVERHPIWRIVDDPVKNRQILDQMPRFTGTNLVERLKPAATALGYSDQDLPNVGKMTVFSCEPFGKGRTFAMATDSTVDWGQFFERNWGEDGDNRYFRKFWRNVIIWLTENAPGANRRLRVETDKMLYRPGQPIKVSAHAFDDKLEQTNRYRLVARLRPAPGAKTRTGAATAIIQEATLAPKSADLTYTAELAAPAIRQLPMPANEAASATRTAALDIVAFAGEQAVAQQTLDVQVLDDPQEFQDLRPNFARLETIASGSGGKVLHNSEELTQLLKSFTITPGDVVVSRAPAWDQAWLWSLLLILLATEWTLRRWWGLA